MKLTLLSWLIVGFTAASLSAAEPDVIPRGWAPGVDATIDRLQRALSEATAQQEMNRLSREIADLQDAELFVIYMRLYQRLPVKEREVLRAEQTKWLVARDKHARASIESEGGSLAAYESNAAEAKFTVKRIAELQKRLSRVEPK